MGEVQYFESILTVNSFGQTFVFIELMCSLCECNCHNLLRFSAPLSSLTRQQQPWLFAPSCHFAYIGTPACQDCDGKRVYQSVDCANR